MPAIQPVSLATIDLANAAAEVDRFLDDRSEAGLGRGDHQAFGHPDAGLQP